MQTLLYIEINIFALSVLLSIFLNVYHRAEKHLSGQKLFFAIIITTSLIIVLDSAMWLLDARPGLILKTAYLIVTAFYYILNPVICMLWLFYADFQVYKEQLRVKKIYFLYSLPAIVNMLFSFISIFTGYMFYIDNNNIYHRGNLFPVMALISYFYLMYSFLKIAVNHKKFQRNDFVPLLIFAIPPFIGGIPQSMFYGVSLIWVCVTLSILIIFINLQNNQLYTDHLTGLYNRRHLDYFLYQRIQSKNYNSLFSAIMIDVDSFKKINDLYGHSIGDHALEDTANILKKTFTKNDFIARYGGDEFVVISDIKNLSALSLVLDKLSDNIARFNESSNAPYKISLSIGYAFFDSNSVISVEKILNDIDALMYENKSKKQPH